MREEKLHTIVPDYRKLMAELLMDLSLRLGVHGLRDVFRALRFNFQNDAIQRLVSERQKHETASRNEISSESAVCSRDVAPRIIRLRVHSRPCLLLQCLAGGQCTMSLQLDQGTRNCPSQRTRNCEIYCKKSLPQSLSEMGTETLSRASVLMLAREIYCFRCLAW